MNYNSKAARLALCALTFGVLIALFHHFFLAHGDREILRVKFSDQTQKVIYMPDSSTGQRLKIIWMASDGETQLKGTIYWNSGLIEDLTFVKSVVVSSIEYYPKDNKPTDPHTVRGVKRADAKFDKDGVTYTYHAVYRPDGTLERLGQLLQAGGSYVSTYYFEDGKTPSRERVFDGLKRYTSEKIYRRDGSLLASIYSKAGDYAKTETSLYRADGTLYANFTRDPIDGEKGHVFAPDGTSMILEYVFDYYGLQEIYLDTKGNLIQNRDGNRMGGLLTVRSYRSVNGKMLMDYRQRWTLTQTIGPEAGKHRLLRVEYFDFAASRTCEIQMDVSGRVVTAVTCPEKDGTSKVRHLTEDGVTIRSIDTVSRLGKVLSSQSGGGKKLEFPEQWFTNYRPTPLPEWKDEGAPPPVYDYH